MLNWLRRPNVVTINKIKMNGCDRDTITALQRRHTELLHHNNEQLETIREQKRQLKELADIAGQSHDLLIQKSIHTGYCGCDLEKRTVAAVAKAKELFNV